MSVCVPVRSRCLLCCLLCLLLDKNHRPLLYSDRKHSWNDPSASLIFLGMALMIKCRFAFPCALACCAISRACCLIKITGHCCTVITSIADLVILILVRCKLADSLLAVVARVDDCLVWVAQVMSLQNLKQYREERKSRSRS